MINRTQEEIIQDWPKNWDVPVVSVLCFAYNQEPYISQTLDGFLMQKTDFPFDVIVHDDASTDETANIIREYENKFPKIIKPIYETENQYSKNDGCLGRIMDDASKGKYWAYCEGDDYWIDENKLQKQVEMLESDKSASMVYTAFSCIDAKGNSVKSEYHNHLMNVSFSGDIFSKLLAGNFILTCTTMYRSEVLLDSLKKKSPVDMDYLNFLFASAKGKCMYMNEVTAKYRIHGGGATQMRKKQVFKNCVEIRRFVFRQWLLGKFPRRGIFYGVCLCLRYLRAQRRANKMLANWPTEQNA